MKHKKPYSFALPDGTDPVALFSVFHNEPFSLFLDSADRKHALSRHSFIAFDPLETIESKNGVVKLATKEETLSFKGDPFAVVKDRLAIHHLDIVNLDHLPPFQGGAAGFFGYDLARGIEKLPAISTDNPLIPDMAVGIYDQIVAFDHQKNKAWYIVWTDEEQNAYEKFRAFRKKQEEVPVEPSFSQETISWESDCSREIYENKVRTVIDYIYDGDIFQANLSQRFEAVLPDRFDPFSHYCILRDVNAAPFSSYMNFGDLKLSSSSPERFLSVQNRQIETRPIKGTRPVSSDPADLLHSEKDRAENVMIVDLLRNDLSKVCEDHAVDVPQLCNLESFSSVHHLVSLVTATLRADETSIDLLRACFPGGSITGAPKIRAMEIIEELEQSRRGPYCGAMGYIGFNDNMDVNITIRTLIYSEGKVRFSVGGGIVSDSDPASEYQETLDKAESIFKSFLTTNRAARVA